MLTFWRTQKSLGERSETDVEVKKDTIILIDS